MTAVTHAPVCAIAPLKRTTNRTETTESTEDRAKPPGYSMCIQVCCVYMHEDLGLGSVSGALVADALVADEENVSAGPKISKTPSRRTPSHSPLVSSLVSLSLARSGRRLTHRKIGQRPHANRPSTPLQATRHACRC